jgi:hypothetical protein
VAAGAFVPADIVPAKRVGHERADDREEQPDTETNEINKKEIHNGVCVCAIKNL